MSTIPFPQPDAAATEPDRTLQCRIDDGFNAWLAQSGGSILCTTYQAGKVIAIGWNGRQPTLLPRNFSKAMGLDLAGDRLAIATRDEVLIYANAKMLAHDFDPNVPGRYDALFLPRVRHYLAEMHVHDLAYGSDGLWLVATRFSCLARLSDRHNFTRAWAPRFVTDHVPEDRCHLNGLAMRDGRPYMVTALGETDTPGGWRADKARGGVLIDVASGEIVLRGLAMPHSPRWHESSLYVLDSGRAQMLRVDPKTGKFDTVCQLEGYLRGLCFIGPYALVGLCKIREKRVFGGLPVEESGAILRCGIALVDLRSGRQAGLFEFTEGVEEMYDVRFIPGVRRPNFLRPDQPQNLNAVSLAEVAYWLRPDKVIADFNDDPSGSQGSPQ